MPEGKQAMVTGGGGDVPMGEGAVGSPPSPANAVVNGDHHEGGASAKRRSGQDSRHAPGPERLERPHKIAKPSEPSGNAARGGPGAPQPPARRGLSLGKTAQRAPPEQQVVRRLHRELPRCARSTDPLRSPRRPGSGADVA